MTSSQKHSGFSVVPWHSSSEWHHVYTQLYGPNADECSRQNAMDTIIMWQMRNHLLPSGVEGTLSIVEALLAKKDKLTSRQYRTILSSSIMRFLNICVANRAPIKTFTTTARKRKIPDWIIDIRHQVAHGQKLPCMNILLLAVAECFIWLQNTYWLPEMVLIQDHHLYARQISKDESDTPRLLHIYCNLIHSCLNNFEIDLGIQEDLRNFGIYESDLFIVMGKIMDRLENNNEGLDQEFVANLIRDIITAQCFTISPLVLIANKEKQKYSVIEMLILFLHEKKCLKHLIHELAIVLNDKTDIDDIRQSASLWLNEIFKGLAKCAKKTNNISDINGQGINFKRASDGNIEDITAMHNSIFKNMNRFSKLCFDSFTLLSVGKFSKKENDSYLKSIERAMNTKYNQNIFNEIDDCNDLCKQINSLETPFIYSGNQNGDDIIPINVDINKKNNIFNTQRWCLETRTHLFETCPLGIIPYEFD